MAARPQRRRATVLCVGTSGESAAFQRGAGLAPGRPDRGFPPSAGFGPGAPQLPGVPPRLGTVGPRPFAGRFPAHAVTLRPLSGSLARMVAFPLGAAGCVPRHHAVLRRVPAGLRRLPGALRPAAAVVLANSSHMADQSSWYPLHP
jgi:hypothetical protein